MSKVKYTRKEAGIQAFFDATGEKLPQITTFEEIKEYVAALPEEIQHHCRQLYCQYMSEGRPDYIDLSNKSTISYILK